MAATATFIVDLFEQHLEELGFLFGQWRRALRDADYTLQAVGHLEERIRAHLQGVQVPGEKAWPRLLDALAGEEPDLVFAAAYALLHTAQPDHAVRVLGAFAEAQDDVLAGLTAALAYGRLHSGAIEQVRTQLSARPAARAVAAAEVLAFHSALQLTGEQLRYFVEHEDPAVRRAGWRVAALLGAQLPPQSYAEALRDEDPSVVIGALEAGAWAGVAGVLPALRRLLEKPRPDALAPLSLLATLGTADDLERIHAAVLTAKLGPRRFDLVATFGAPTLVPLLLDAMGDADPATAAAAGHAFTRLTDVDVASGRREAVQPAGEPPDEIEAEFLDEVTLPDAAKARQEWERMAARFGSVVRFCRGIDAARALEPDFAARIDMQSRRELHLRARFTRAWQGTLLDLERFPQSATRTASTPASQQPAVYTAAPLQR